MKRSAGVADLVTERLLARGSGTRQVTEAVAGAAPLLSADGRRAVSEAVGSRLAGGSLIDSLLHDDLVTEVMINGPGPVRIERLGRIETLPLVMNVDDIHRTIERLLAATGRRVDRSQPILDVRIDDRTRCHVVVPPVAVGGPVLSLRRFPALPRPLDDVAGLEHAGRLRALLAGRASMLVHGATSSGKTTLLSALLAEVADSERVVVVEEAAEIPLIGGQHLRLEAQPANIDGQGQITMEQLVASALRLRPDRIVIGEVRGSEAFDLLQALATGHTGSLATVHAAHADQALWRVASLAARRSGAGDVDRLLVEARASFDVVVGMDRGAAGERRVVHIEELS
ncbi:MAG: pilus assembly protein CpaF [Candidatus Poriferisodalaceae bacterium]|jgi:pilus assembly protein CpaF